MGGVSNENVKFMRVVKRRFLVGNEGAKLKIIPEERVVLQERVSLLTGIRGNQCCRLVFKDWMRIKDQLFERHETGS